MDEIPAAARSPAVSWLKAVAIGLTFLLLAFAGGMIAMELASRRAQNAASSIVWQFAPGRPSRNFLARGRSLGADRFTLEPGEGPERSGARLSLERRSKDFAARWDTFESDYERIDSGAAEVTFNGAPPFERQICRIEFKNGAVVSMRRGALN